MRPDKNEYYLGIARETAKRSTCLRRSYGAIIVNNDEIISTGYNGTPRGKSNCCELKSCRRQELNIAQGERYELCRSVHAEQNAIISSSRDKMLGSTLYLVGLEGLDIDNGVCRIIDASPCLICARMILNAGIKTIVCSRKNSEPYILETDSEEFKWEI